MAPDDVVSASVSGDIADPFLFSNNSGDEDETSIEEALLVVPLSSLEIRSIAHGVAYVESDGLGRNLPSFNIISTIEGRGEDEEDG